MFYTIYKITNKINKKYYIGKHQTKELNDDYMGSGKIIKKAIKKYGIENFTKEILFVFDNEQDMNNKEKELVIISEQSYNLCEGGKGGFGYINKNGLGGTLGWKHPTTPEYIEKMKKRNLGRSCKEETKQKISKSKIGRVGTFKNRYHSEETRRKMSISAKNPNIINSQFGTMWITNGQENKKIKKEDIDNWIPLGYYKGRKFL